MKILSKRTETRVELVKDGYTYQGTVKMDSDSVVALSVMVFKEGQYIGNVGYTEESGNQVITSFPTDENPIPHIVAYQEMQEEFKRLVPAPEQVESEETNTHVK